MSACPFCHHSIHAELAVHGGTCPHCFAEIPGEETATDPGEEVKAAQAEEDRRRARRRALIPVLAALPVVIGVIGYAVWSLQPDQEVEMLVMDDFELEIDLAEWVEPTVEPDPEPVAKSGGGSKSAPAKAAARPAATAGSTESTEDLAARLAAANAPSGTSGARRPTAGSAEAAEGARPLDAPAASSGSASAGGFGLALSVQRTQALLTDSTDIQSAVKDLVRSKVPRLQLCFERSLKGNPELGGTWKLSFTIGKDGAVTEAAASGEQMQDAPFEACLDREMTSWRIAGRLEKPWPVTLPLKFNPSG